MIMIVTAIKTQLVHGNESTLHELMAKSVTSLDEKSIIAVSSKIVALCQNRIIDRSTIAKSDLVEREADFYLPRDFSRYGFQFTITNNTFISSAGIDESNGDGYFVLWPKDPQRVANELRAFLQNHFGLNEVGVIITDSTSMPLMRLGAVGIMLAHSGFVAVNHLAREKDLFGRSFVVEKAAIGSGLAVAANVVMGEGAEQTPIAIISDAPFVKFQLQDPTEIELKSVYISSEDDLYEPFIQAAPWRRGKGQMRDPKLP
ncbi:MAG: putative folate metabolism gamma-glutamate ligase [Candidatus Saccharibacteria bacterium]|nr:putative folate metabolism gamma-glutamate ligase [Candidatus Saccharibacteria bacterium]